MKCPTSLKDIPFEFLVKSVILVICSAYFLRDGIAQLNQYLERKSYMSSSVSYENTGVNTAIVTFCPIPAMFDKNIEEAKWLESSVISSSLNASEASEAFEKTQTESSGVCVTYRDRQSVRKEHPDILCSKWNSSLIVLQGPGQQLDFLMM